MAVKHKLTQLAKNLTVDCVNRWRLRTVVFQCCILLKLLRGKFKKSLTYQTALVFEMKNGLAYRKHQRQILFYVPAALESSVMYKYHNEMSHVGPKKRYATF